MLAFLSEAVGKSWNAPSRVTDDPRARTADYGRVVKSQYRYEVAHGQNPRMHGSAYFEFLSTRRETRFKQSRDRKARLTGSSM